MNKINFFDLIKLQKIERPHVFLLGAGASLQAFPHGDKNGRKLPLMNDLLTTTGLDNLIKDDINLSEYNTSNFENFYSQISKDKKLNDILKIVDSHLWNYFSELELPETPTIYDYLVLSLRDKDVIGTFNWDPFLWKAAVRNHKIVKMPNSMYLHGNVAIGADLQNKLMGPVNAISSKGTVFEPIPILYPIDSKNYQENQFIESEWQKFQSELNQQLIFTVFGYGAPSSDVEAIRLLKEAWGNTEDNQFEETEIIDIRDKNEISDLWNPFIHTHHYGYHHNFFDSLAALYPRRSCEAFYQNTMMAQFVDASMRLKQHNSMAELWKWFEPIINQEFK